MNVPRVDLAFQEKPLKEEIMTAISEVIDSYHLIMGKNVADLEKQTANYIGVPESVAVANGTDALKLSLVALGIGKGDEVITTPFTFGANVEALLLLGAKPVFADVDKETFNISPDLIEEKITKKTKAILPVHLFGCPAEIGKIKKTADNNNLPFIEDCAQAFGAEYKGKKCGSFGELSGNSFYPTKNLGCYGDGGIIYSNTIELSEKLRLLRFHGQKEQYTYKYLGWNSRLDEIQAAILLIKLKHIDEWNNYRIKAAEWYKEELSDVPEITIPVVPKNVKHIFHLYTLKTEKRDLLKKHLEKNSIGTTINYPAPLHMQEAFSGIGKKGNYPNAEWLCEKSISIPMFVGITHEQVNFVSEKIKEFYS